jgi:hypothetical protein
MERETLRSLGKPPLPGERQSTSRAGARRDSMRATSGSRLTRRITARKNPTADTIMDSQQQRVLNTAESVLMERQPTTTKAGTVRKRIMWTNQMNKDIIRCYMKCTKIETELTAYRQKMYTQFVEPYPEISERLSEQNVADRRRAYKYTVTEVLENRRYKLYWNIEVRTDIRVSANRPDILLYDKENNETDLIDIAVPLSHNIQNMYAQKINKYAELATEIQQMWNVQKINIRPMVISATGIVSQHLKKELEIIQLLPAIQRSVLLDTCHTVRQFLRN